MPVCPSCGGKNAIYKRETTKIQRNGTTYNWSKTVKTRSSNSQILHRTIGFCKDCGYDWVVKEEEPQIGCFGEAALFFIKLIFFLGCPYLAIPIWFIFTKRITGKTKVIILLIFLGVCLVLGIIGAIYGYFNPEAVETVERALPFK